MEELGLLALLVAEYKNTDANKEPIKKCRLYIEILKLGGKPE